MSEVYTFTAPIESGGRGAHVVVPFDVEAAFGSKRPPVRATFDGVEYRGTLVRMGGPEHLLIVRSDVRDLLGKGPGDEVEVAIALDDQPRTVDVPDDLAQALDAAGLRATFDALAYTHRKEYVRWVEEAKKPETRERRLAGTVERLQA